jgi:hypothetical protein
VQADPGTPQIESWAFTLLLSKGQVVGVYQYDKAL